MNSKQSDAKTVEEYLDNLSEERKEALGAVREVVLKNLPDGMEEVMNWGMITYQVPLETYPDTYNGKPLMYAALASQKNYMALYLMCVYSDDEIREWFEDEYEKSGKKMDMGKSCVRFKELDNLPLDVVGKAIAKNSVDEFIDIYEKSRS